MPYGRLGDEEDGLVDKMRWQRMMDKDDVLRHATSVTQGGGGTWGSLAGYEDDQYYLHHHLAGANDEKMAVRKMLESDMAGGWDKGSGWSNRRPRGQSYTVVVVLVVRRCDERQGP